MASHSNNREGNSKKLEEPNLDSGYQSSILESGSSFISESIEEEKKEVSQEPAKSTPTSDNQNQHAKHQEDTQMDSAIGLSGELSTGIQNLSLEQKELALSENEKYFAQNEDGDT